MFLLLVFFVGFMTGLLGFGDGGIMLSALTSLFLLQNMPVENIVHLALGISMAAFITPSFSSLNAQPSQHAVFLKTVKNMAPDIIMGTFIASLFVSQISAFYLALFF